jgi:hypothetical protein
MVEKSQNCINFRPSHAVPEADAEILDSGVAFVCSVFMANKVTGVRLPDTDVEFLEAWAANENSKQLGPKWTVAYLIQRAVRELIARKKETERDAPAGA